ncbi:hypothetical protein NI385_25835 (plasmid) [Vibrio parahaemolyticus]|nr:hypothetical protein NI385_25835 [Vibrio parahaemolyticus]
MDIDLFLSWFVVLFIFMISTSLFKRERDAIWKDSCFIGGIAFGVSLSCALYELPLTFSFGFYLVLLISSALQMAYLFSQYLWYRASFLFLLVLCFRPLIIQ